MVAPPAPSAPTEDRVLTTADLEPQPTTLQSKLHGYDLWRDMGEPQYIVAPMVDQSELAWRVLSRLHGANLCYTPMFHAALFSSQPSYAPSMFDTSPDSIEGVAPYDRPLIVQFCANDKEQWLEAAQKVEGRCDAVDLNLGCPQGIAKRGHYGAFLMEEWSLIRDMISHLHQHLSIPVIAKIRVFPSLAKTLQYAAHVYASGAQLLAVHGRTREAKGQLAGFASWPKIKAVVDLVSPKVPVLANGGVPGAEEVEPCLAETGAKGLLSAEGNLYNPMIFSPANAAAGRAYLAALPPVMRDAILACNAELTSPYPESWSSSPSTTQDKAAYAPATFLASQYLAIVLTLPSTQTALSAVKAHLYKLFRPVWAAGRGLEMRETLGRCGNGGKGVSYKEKVEQYVAWVDQFRELLKADLAACLLPADSNRLLTHSEVVKLYGGVVPYSHCQPYLRVKQADETMTGKEEEELKKVDGEAKRKREVEEGTVTDPDADLSKRLKPSPPSPAPHSTGNLAIDSTAPAASAVPTAVACSGPSLTPSSSSAPPSTSTASSKPPCANSAAAKCSNNACKACCLAIRTASSGLATSSSASAPASSAVVVKSRACEFHEEKERKAREQVEEKKALQRRRKEEGKRRVTENEEKLRLKREADRLAREAKKAGVVEEKREE